MYISHSHAHTHTLNIVVIIITVKQIHYILLSISEIEKFKHLYK